MYRHKIEIWFELETRCNLKCKFCYNYWKNGKFIEPKRLGASELIRGFRNLLEVVDCNQVAISGGEPLLRKDIIEIIQFFREMNIPMILTTNGLLLNKSKIALFKKSDIQTFQIPLHSMDAGIHDFLSGNECFFETIETILNLLENNCHVIPVFVATKINLNHFLNVLKSCSHMGISEIIFNRFIPSGFGEVNQHILGCPSDQELSEVLEKCYEFAKKSSIVIHLGVPILLLESFNLMQDYIKPASCPVRLAQTRWTIDSSCNIRRCNHSHQNVGNLLSDGADVILKELSMQHECSNQFHSCQFIETEKTFAVPIR
jgi:MoaA/NifB/PqqE/SkfB family radical SAM enzyme